MDLTLLKLRHKFEDFARDTLKVHEYGAGTDLTTGEVDFSFELKGHTYSVHIKELTNLTEDK